MILIILSYSITAADCDGARTNIDLNFNDAFDIDVGDVDLDGDNDVLVSGAGADDKIVLYENSGQGFFPTSSIIDDTGNEYRNSELIDLDGDGDLDIVSGVFLDNDLNWYENDGTGAFSKIEINTSLSSNVIDVAGGDIDNDGDIDIIAAINGNNRIEKFINDGSEVFSVKVSPLTLTGLTRIKLIDVDGDNDLDLLVISSAQSYVKWLENDGLGNFAERTITNTLDSPNDVVGIDLDGDGDIDVISAHSDSIVGRKDLEWYENDGNEVFTIRNITSVGDIISIAAADMDNDGDIDIVVSEKGGTGKNILLIYNNDGNQLFTETNVSSNFNALFHAEVGLITADNVPDILFSDNTANEVGYFIGEKCQAIQTLSFLSCDFPTLFCDDFNYNVPIMSNSENTWVIRNNDRSINTSLRPINNELSLRQNGKFISVEHQTTNFPVNYRTSKTTRTTKSKFSPIFSTEFILNFNNNTNNAMEFQASSEENQGGYIISVELDSAGGNASGNMNWFYLNNSVDGFEFISLCSNCTSSGIDLNIKINTFFSHRDIFPFNATISEDLIELYINDILIGTFRNFITPTDYLSFYSITKFTKGNSTIDDYFVMVGTDKDVDLSILGFTDIFDNSTSAQDSIAIDAIDGDMAAALDSIWDDMGLKSVASKMISGLFLMILLALVMFGAALQTNHPLSARVLIVVELFFMILLVFIKLLPIWLPFIVVIVAAGIGAAVTKFGTQSP